MFKYILEAVPDINWMAIIPLLLFFLFFTIILIRTIIQKQGFIDQMSMLPLKDDYEVVNIKMAVNEE